MASSKATILMVVSMFLFICIKSGAHNHIHLRKKELSLYYFDTFNVTSFLVAQPALTPGGITPTDSPFGSLFFLNVLIQEGPDRTSAQLGNFTGSFFESLHPSGSQYMVSGLLTFSNNSSPSNPELQGLHGILAVSGIIAAFSDSQPLPITGGTGSFAFAVGSLTFKPIDVATYAQAFGIDLVLYWPPYAPTNSF